jgi:hypothetical protein
VTAALGSAESPERRRATVFSARPGRRHGEILNRVRTRTDADRLMLLKELIAHGKPPEWGLTNCLTLISGPSKTADIELTMVHGAHGPREVYLYVIT